MTIAVVDYGAGNLTSVIKALRIAGATPAIARTPGHLDGVSGIVIPGVGHFGATRAIDAAWRAAILDAVSPKTGARPVPLLGICLGMQWLFEGSDEAPGVPGLGVLAGRVGRLSSGPLADGAPRIKVPHVGWNTLEIVRPSAPLSGLEPGTAMYFTHGYAVRASTDARATTTHGETFVSVAERESIWGVQFHPEKSGRAGLTLLRNWMTLCSANV